MIEGILQIHKGTDIANTELELLHDCVQYTKQSVILTKIHNFNKINHQNNTSIN